MTQSQFVKRIENLERELEGVKKTLPTVGSGQRKLADDFFGVFHGDPYFKRAMECGAEYRRSLRPGKRKKSAAKMILLDTDHVTLLQWGGSYLLDFRKVPGLRVEDVSI